MVKFAGLYTGVLVVFSTINMAALCYIVQSTHHHEMTTLGFVYIIFQLYIFHRGGEQMV